MCSTKGATRSQKGGSSDEIARSPDKGPKKHSATMHHFPVPFATGLFASPNVQKNTPLDIDATAHSYAWLSMHSRINPKEARRAEYERRKQEEAEERSRLQEAQVLVYMCDNISGIQAAHV